eukprot:scaffold21036_cov80-Skeletonema_menzelii.AAC.3
MGNTNPEAVFGCGMICTSLEDIPLDIPLLKAYSTLVYHSSFLWSLSSCRSTMYSCDVSEIRTPLRLRWVGKSTISSVPMLVSMERAKAAKNSIYVSLRACKLYNKYVDRAFYAESRRGSSASFGLRILLEETAGEQLLQFCLVPCAGAGAWSDSISK